MFVPRIRCCRSRVKKTIFTFSFIRSNAPFYFHFTSLLAGKVHVEVDQRMYSNGVFFVCLNISQLRITNQQHTVYIMSEIWYIGLSWHTCILVPMANVYYSLKSRIFFYRRGHFFINTLSLKSYLCQRAKG